MITNKVKLKRFNFAIYFYLIKLPYKEHCRNYSLRYTIFHDQSMASFVAMQLLATIITSFSMNCIFGEIDEIHRMGQIERKGAGRGNSKEAGRKRGKNKKFRQLEGESKKETGKREIEIKRRRERAKKSQKRRIRIGSKGIEVNSKYFS